MSPLRVSVRSTAVVTARDRVETEKYMQELSRRTKRLVIAGALVATGLIAPTPALAAPAGTIGPSETYLVVFKGSSSPADAGRTVTAAGGSVVADYDKIGVLVARSDNPAFAARLRANPKVEGATATADYATRLDDLGAEGDAPSGPPSGGLPHAPAADEDSLSPLQWDMRQIQVPEAHGITGAARPWSSVTSIPAPTTGTPICGPTSPTPTARTASAGPPSRGPRRPTTTTGTARTPPAPSPRRPTTPASSVSRRT